MPQRLDFTSVERGVDSLANRILDRAPVRGPVAWLVEFIVFGLKQAWACVFGATLLAVLIATRIWYPDQAALDRADFITVTAIVIQAVMLATRLEEPRELRVILVFHVVGTVMELFKTSAGSWTYEGGGVLHLGAVPLYSGFMYGAVGSYLVRVFRLFDLRFTRYPPRWLTGVVAVLIYLNFFTHHFTWDFRLPLFAAVVVVWGRCLMHFRIFRWRLRMPVLVAFLLVAIFMWVAENIGTWSNAWLYPGQADGWQLVSIGKLGAWLLLMIISVVLVTWVYPPRGLDSAEDMEKAVGMAKVEHFEIPTDDIVRAQGFYREVFGFRYEPWGDDMGVIRAPEEGGINGDLHLRGAAPHPTVVFTVSNLEETIAAVIANGGEKHGDIQQLTETSRWAYVKDSEGNIIGLYDEIVDEPAGGTATA